MITITIQDKRHEFPGVDFSDLEVFEACRNIQTISEEYLQAYPDNSDPDAVLAFLQDYGHRLIEQIDFALGENVCFKMFGNRMNIEKLRTAAEQLVDGMTQAWGNTTPQKPQAPVYPLHGQKTGKHRNAYQKPKQKHRNSDVIEKAKNMSKEEKAALLAALLE
ncbi:MAG: hypothetical protein LUE11_12935 [Clostridia bacterium]|nr:hypothetical protein [Clostridia bacterium]